jgi:hypothetical protein
MPPPEQQMAQSLAVSLADGAEGTDGAGPGGAPGGADTYRIRPLPGADVLSPRGRASLAGAGAGADAVASMAGSDQSPVIT